MTALAQTAWREGFAPSLSVAELRVLRQALVSNDPRLIQNHTVRPVMYNDWVGVSPVAACAIGFCGWKADDLNTVDEVEDFFSRVCYNANIRLGTSAQCRYFLNWFDDTPREEMRTELLEEVNLTLASRPTFLEFCTPIAIGLREYS